MNNMKLIVNFFSVHLYVCASSVGHIMSMLHMRQLWTTALLLFTLHIFRMQRPAHSRPFRNETAQYRTRTMLRHDLLPCMQRFHLRSRMLCNGTKTFAKRGEVKSQHSHSAIQSNTIRVTVKFDSIFTGT